MLEILADRTYRHLFLAQVVALLGTGLATVALGLLAFDLAADGAAMVPGTVSTIKMVAMCEFAWSRSSDSGRMAAMWDADAASR